MKQRRSRRALSRAARRAALLGAVAVVFALGFVWRARTIPTSVEAAAASAPYRQIGWDDLVPAGWNPRLAADGARSPLADSDPRAEQMLADLRATWDAAPTVDALNGSSVRLPGYVVPLDVVDGELKEFLLVPYFGACIHTPPPPANQIVLVSVKQPAKGFRTMDTVWATGRLTTMRQASVLGVSGYRLEAMAIEHYQPTAR